MALLEKPAKVIYDAAVSRSGRYRFASGRDAKIVNLMKRVLPEHIPHEFGIEDDVIEYISLNVIEVFKHVQ